MMASIALRIALVAILLAAVLVGSGLLIGSLVVALASVLGLAWALATVGFGFLFFALMLVFWVRSLARAAQKRRTTTASMVGLAELALMLLPKTTVRRLGAGVTAGIGLAALVVLLLKPHIDKES